LNIHIIPHLTQYIISRSIVFVKRVTKKIKGTPRGAFALVAGVGFEPHDLRVMRSYIDVAPVIDVLDRTSVTIIKPTISP